MSVQKIFTVGKVSRARKIKVFLVEDDLVYMELDNLKIFPVKKDVLTIFRRVKERVPKVGLVLMVAGKLVRLMLCIIIKCHRW